MKRKYSLSRTKKLTLSAAIVAIVFVLLYLGAIIDVLDLTTAALASIVMVISVVEIGGFYPWAIYAVASVLSLVLLPSKLPGLMFLLFAGFYPIIKEKIEPLNKVLSWFIKIVIFNAAFTAVTLIAEKILGLTDLVFSLSVIIYLLGNITFVVYDIALSKLIFVYFTKIRKRLGFKDKK